MSELNVTLKHGKGYEETWTVFRGTAAEIRNDIAGYFGMESSYVEGVTLHELVIAATHLVHGTGNVAAVLGAVPISVTESLTGGPTGPAAWDQIDNAPAEPAAAVEPFAALVAQLQAAGTVDDLKRLWAENQAAFSDVSVKAAYSVRGKALKAAA